MIRLVMPGFSGRERSEYCCEKCYPYLLNVCTSVKRVEMHEPRPNELCPQCGEVAT